MRMEVERPKRTPGLTEIQKDAAFAELAVRWNIARTKGKGTLDAAIVLKSKNTHGCLAEVEYLENLTEGQLDRKTLSGQFGTCHAEMDALQKFHNNGNGLGYFESLKIEKEPCPRCAAILGLLGIKARYKQGGSNKDYPTWTFPNLGLDWANIMGVDKFATHSKDKDDLLHRFCTQIWWA
jgi:deoxycytidylate deaminase